MKEANLLIVNDHRIFRKSVAIAIKEFGIFDLIYEAESGVQALNICRTMRVSLVLLDLNAPGINGIEIVEEIFKIPAYRRPFIIMVSQYNATSLIFDMLKLGVQGYLSKTSGLDDLQSAIKTVLKGDLSYPREYDDKIKTYIFNDKMKYIRLSKEEKYLIHLLSEGKLNKEIAPIMNYSVRTIESKRIRLEKKLKVRNTAELIKFAFRNAILNISES